MCCLTWKPHIQYIENKISKNIGLLYKAKFLLNQKSLKSIYFSFIHSYLNYANVAWGNTHQTKLKKLVRFQKHASRIIYNEDRTAHARPLMKALNALNVYQINILQNILLTYKSKNKLAPTIFQKNFEYTNISIKVDVHKTFTYLKQKAKTQNLKFRIADHIYGIMC